MSIPQWKGLWDWSMRHHDGTSVSNFKKEDIDPEKMKWLEEALKHYMQDFVARMRDIKAVLDKDTDTASARDTGAGGSGSDGSSAALEDKEALLEELMDIVSSIDYARDLHKIGGLTTLMDLLASPHASLRWRAAEVVATCVSNNPPVQQWFLEGGVMPRLLALCSPHQPAVVRTKALLALSAMVRHYSPALDALRASGGLAAVVGCTDTRDPRLARKAMTTLQYMLVQRREDGEAACRCGAAGYLGAALGDHSVEGAASEGAPEMSAAEASDVRQAALGALLALARCPGCWQAVREVPGLRARLAALEAAHLVLGEGEREAQHEELVLLRELQGVLGAAAAPVVSATAASDHVSVAEWEAQGQQHLGFSVNAAQAAAAAGAAVAAAGDGQQQQQQAAPAMGLLGPP